MVRKPRVLVEQSVGCVEVVVGRAARARITDGAGGDLDITPL